MREEAEDALREWRGCPMGRRAFLKVVGSGIVLTLAAPVLTSCSGVTSTLDAVLEGKRSFTDDAGRQMTLPTADRLKRIYFTSTAAQIFCFTLMPSLLAGTAFKFTKEELAYLPAGTASLPYMGTLTDGGQINREMLLTEDVQIVFSISSVSLTDQNISEAETLQNATKIPVLCFDGSMERIAQCYRRLGDVMGCGTRAEELASYCEGVYTRVAEAIATVPDTERVSLYYAEGPEGLQTEPDTSQHAQPSSWQGPAMWQPWPRMRVSVCRMYRLNRCSRGTPKSLWHGMTSCAAALMRTSVSIRIGLPCGL